MLRARFDRNTRDMPEPEFRRWSSRIVASLFDLLAVVIVAGIMGAVAISAIQSDRTHRIQVAEEKTIDAQRHARKVDRANLNLACLALHYLPPETGFYRDLRALYPKCPPYKGADPNPNLRPSRSGNSRSGSPASPGSPDSRAGASADHNSSTANRPPVASTGASPSPEATVTRSVPVPGKTKTVTSGPPTQKASTLPLVPCVSVAVVRLNCE